MSKRLVKGTNSFLDDQEADFGPLLDVFKTDGSLKFHSKFRQLIQFDEDKPNGIYIEDGFLVDISEDQIDAFNHGEFLKETVHKTKNYNLTLLEFENILQLVIWSVRDNKALYSCYKRPMYLPLIRDYFANFNEKEDIIKMINMIKELI